jgi:lysozyme
MKDQEVTAEGEAKIILREGTKLNPYLDNKGIPTIGNGTTVYPDGRKVTMQDPPITNGQALEYMRIHLRKEVYPLIKRYIKVPLNSNQFDALCSFVYNLGTQALWNVDKTKKSYNTPTQVNLRINTNPNDPTIKDAMLMFDRSNKGVWNRHVKEADQYFTPVK